MLVCGNYSEAEGQIQSKFTESHINLVTVNKVGACEIFNNLNEGIHNLSV